MSKHEMDFLQCGKAPRAQRADQRRQHILNVARDLVSQRGFHRASMAQIAAASGVAIGQIYRDFKAKEDIIAAIAERDVADFLREDALAAAIAHDDRAAVRGWVERLVTVDESVEDCRMMCEILAEMGRNPRIAGVNQCIESRVRVGIAAALTALAGGTADQDAIARLADLVMLLSIGLVSRRIADPALDIETLSETLSRIIDDELARIAAPT